MILLFRIRSLLQKKIGVEIKILRESIEDMNIAEECDQFKGVTLKKYKFINEHLN